MKLNSVFRITLIYLLFGLLWIYFSDQLLHVFAAGDAHLISRLQTYKGFFYVGCTTLLLFFLVKGYTTELKKRINSLKKSEEELIRSEEKYKLLFDASPMPAFIYQPDTNKILNVNNAAIYNYGYTSQEFSQMHIQDIEVEEDVSRLEEKLRMPMHEAATHSNGIFRHKKKDGELIYVYTQGSNIEYKGVEAQIIMANDITRQLHYIDTVESQNKKLNEIAWMQSHVVRAPLASLMGLVHLLKDSPNDTKEYKELLDKVLNTANELDNVIRKISDNTDTKAYIQPD